MHPSPDDPAQDDQTRAMIAVVITFTVLGQSAMAAFWPAAMPVFDKCFQAFLLVLGYYFGRRSR